MHSIFPPPGADNRPVMGWPEAAVNIATIGVFAAMIFMGILPAGAFAFSMAIHLGRSS
ncbi:hypothetical protein [Streptomyces sp. NPDC046909]|uniref:hypothetical protein n=1 Tax=Streptomyces sp. NPDC046909 TaxID=3155617 RepID=UPI0033EDA1FA